MSSSRRQQHPADGGAGGAVRQDDAHLRTTCSSEWYRLVVRARPSRPAIRSRRSSRSRAAIVARSHGEEAARAAEAHFTRVVREGRAPDEVPEAPLPAGDPVHLPALLVEAFGLSTSEARRLIAQGGVKVDGEVVDASSICRARELVGRARAGGQAALRPACALSA